MTRIIKRYDPMIAKKEISKSPVITPINLLVLYHAGMTTYEVVRSKEDQSLAMIVSDLNVIMEYTYDV